MGNLPNRDTDASYLLSEMLGIFSEDKEYGSLVPDILQPRTYGFST